jgi:hypothetical protein
MKACIAGFLGAVVLCACAVSPPPEVDLASLTCTSLPALEGATPLTFDPKKPKATIAILDAHSRCMDNGHGGRSLYQVFALPRVAAPYLLLLTAPPWGNTLLAPQALFLDGAGAVERRSSRADFIFRGDALSAALRSHPGESYLVVASDPEAIGQAVARVDQSFRGQMYAAGTVFVTVYTGLDVTRHLVLTPAGTLTITTAPLEGQK